MSRQFKIAVIPGDGVGREVIPHGRRVLEQIARKHSVRFDFEEFDWGASYYFAHQTMMPPNALDLLRNSDAILLGAVGHPDIPDHVTLNGLLLPIRRAFDQYANVRPARLYPGVTSPLASYGHGAAINPVATARGTDANAPLAAHDPADESARKSASAGKLESARSIDLVVVRENTEGEYAQVGGFVYDDRPDEVAIQTAVFTRRGIERIVRFAFELAVKRNKKKRVTSITKSNAQGFGMVLWDKVFASVASEFPGIATESLLVDAAAMNFIRRPESFDVVVASNLFGDILSDISAIIIGSMGLAPSANLDPLRRYPSMFEPVHGSAPDIAGRGIVNPLATILSCGMMLDHLGLADAATKVEAAVAAVLAAGWVRTPDLGGTSSTREVADAVLDELQ